MDTTDHFEQVGWLTRYRTRLANSSFVIGASQAVCFFLIAANGVKLLLSGTGQMLAFWGSSFFHSDPIRIPMLTIASVCSILALASIVNGWMLRRRPAAQWRIQPLSKQEKRKVWASAVMSSVTLLLVIGETVAHWIMHK